MRKEPTTRRAMERRGKKEGRESEREKERASAKAKASSKAKKICRVLSDRKKEALEGGGGGDGVPFTALVSPIPSLSRSHPSLSPPVLFLPSSIVLRVLPEHQRLRVALSHSLSRVHDKIDTMYQRQTTKPLALSASPDSNRARRDTIIIARPLQPSRGSKSVAVTFACDNCARSRTEHCGQVTS